MTDVIKLALANVDKVKTQRAEFVRNKMIDIQNNKKKREFDVNKVSDTFIHILERLSPDGARMTENDLKILIYQKVSDDEIIEADDNGEEAVRNISRKVINSLSSDTIKLSTLKRHLRLLDLEMSIYKK